MSKDNSSEWSAVITFLFIVLFGLGIFVGVAGTTQSFRKDAVLKGHAHWVVDVAGNTTFEWNQLVSNEEIAKRFKEAETALNSVNNINKK